MCVVILDQDDGVRAALRMIVRRAGYTVVDVEDAAEALTMRTTPKSVVVRGPSHVVAAQILTRLRQRWGAVPAVVISARSAHEPPIRGGCDTTVLHAPVSEGRILEALKERMPTRPRGRHI